MRRRRRIPVWVMAVAPAVALVIVTLSLFWSGVTLGQGAIFYRWSALELIRLKQTALLVPAGGAVAAAVWMLGAGKSRAVAGVLATSGVVLTAAWVWTAPPAADVHIAMNYSSPSQDGAFVLEAFTAPTFEAYLRAYPKRMGGTVDEMLGSRVLSNPPGTTMLAYAARSMPAPPFVDAALAEASREAPEMAERFGAGFKLALILLAMWAAATLPVYAAARSLLPAGPALAATVVGVFSTATLCFAPGKDPAQLLFVGLQFLGAVAAARSGTAARRLLGAALLGVATAAGTGVGLICLWTGLCLAAFGVWESARAGGGARAVTLVLAAAGGAVATLFAFSSLLGWDLVETTRIVAAKYPEVQKTIRIDRGTYLLIGLPIFLLFVPAPVFSAVLARRPRLPHAAVRTAPGLRLLICTAGTMAVTYVVGIPYELPRLWIPFLPMLAVGAFTVVPLFHSRSRAATRFAAGVLCLHLATSAVQWSVMDLRESEYRLREHRGYG